MSRVVACMTINMTTLLQRERDNQAWSPRALRINGWRYSGVFDADLIAKAICSGFTQQPMVCANITHERNPFQPYVVTKVEGLSFGKVLQLFFLMGACMLTMMFFYRRHLSRQIRTSVREEVMLEVQ